MLTKTLFLFVQHQLWKAIRFKYLGSIPLANGQENGKDEIQLHQMHSSALRN